MSSMDSMNVGHMAAGELGIEGADKTTAEFNEPASVLRRLVSNKFAVVSTAVILIFVLGAVFAPVLTPYDHARIDLSSRLLPPSFAHPLGTDEGGRDVLSRILYGARISLLIGVVPTLMSLVVGTVLGMVAGFWGGKVDTVIMRIADIVMAFPTMLLAMVIMYTLGGGLMNVFLTMVLICWAGMARVVRAETLALRETEYVEAARVIGVKKWVIVLRHILPNCIPTLIVMFALEIPSSILTESALSFLGMGVQAPNTSWGLMINTGSAFLYHAPWLCFAPCVAIMVIVLAFNYLGDGLRDVLDPHKKDQ